MLIEGGEGSGLLLHHFYRKVEVIRRLVSRVDLEESARIQCSDSDSNHAARIVYPYAVFADVFSCSLSGYVLTLLRFATILLLNLVILQTVNKLLFFINLKRLLPYSQQLATLLYPVPV
jgi:hypothetical protein